MSILTVPNGAVPSLIMRLFGPFEVCVEGHPLPRLRSRKTQWLLAFLALRHRQEIARDVLAAILWPDSSEALALASLRKSVKDLRHALGPEADRLRAPRPRTLSLEMDGADVDLLAFDQAIARGDEGSLAQATALYRGPLVEGCAEPWVLPERQAREQAYLAALETLATQAVARGDPATAERHLRRAVATDPLRETAQRALMQTLAAAGQYAAALLVYRELRLLLHRELNAEPDRETTALFQQLQAEARQKAALGARRSALGEGGDRFHTGRLAPAFAESREPSAERRSGATLTFLFSDIEGSTRLWEADPEAMRAALARHDQLLHQAIDAHAGTVFKTVGDQFCAVFATAPDAVAAALAAQRALHASLREGWASPPLPVPIRVRMALHTGTVEEQDGDYFGPPLNRIARLLQTGHGGQILLSRATAELIRDRLPEGVDLRDLGEWSLPDLIRPEPIVQLVAPDLPAEFPPLRSREHFRHNLPVPLTSFIGREREIAEIKALMAASAREYPLPGGLPRLVTLTGAGGCGKTRLALQLAAELVPELSDGVWWVELAALSDPSLVLPAVAAVLGVREAGGAEGASWGPGPGGRPLTAALSDYLRPRSLLLVLDNCEHLLAACAQSAELLLRSCPDLRILATSREGLGITGETTYYYNVGLAEPIARRRRARRLA